MNRNVDYYLAFSYCLGIGPMRFNALITAFGDLEHAYKADIKAVQEIIGDEIGKTFVNFRQSFDPKKTLEELKQKQITILTREDPQYPEQLRSITDAPICLYVKGNLDTINFSDDNFFAIVGTRRLTSYGSYVAKRFGTELTNAEFIIVSGMALGIDAAAHNACLEAGGKTIAFLGCGVDVIYPHANKHLYERIIKDGGLVISEFPPGHTVKPGLFVARNRLISGLSKGVLVVERAKDSGSLITARYAAEQGKDVFAVPSPINSIYSEGPNLLLKEGAKLVTTVEDILEEYNLSISQMKSQLDISKLTATEKQIVLKLQLEPLTADDITKELQLQIQELLPSISSLEIQNIIEKNMEGKYQLK